MKNKQNKLIIVEGFSGIGKTKFIKTLLSLVGQINNINVFDKNHPKISILYGTKRELSFNHNKFSKFSIRTSRLYLALNIAKKENCKINILDRGLLTYYINSKIDNLDNNQVEIYLKDLKVRANKFDYATVFLDGSIKKANDNLRINRANYKDRVQENLDFKPYLDKLDSYDFLGKLIKIDAEIDFKKDIDKVIKFIGK